MRDWLKTSWDHSDLMQLSASLEYLDSHPKELARHRMVAQAPFMVIGAPGGWTLRPNLVFYGSLVMLFALRELGEPFAQFVTLPMLTMFAVISLSFGSIRSGKQSTISSRCE